MKKCTREKTITPFFNFLITKDAISVFMDKKLEDENVKILKILRDHVLYNSSFFDKLFYDNKYLADVVIQLMKSYQRTTGKVHECIMLLLKPIMRHRSYSSGDFRKGALLIFDFRDNQDFCEEFRNLLERDNSFIVAVCAYSINVDTFSGRIADVLAILENVNALTEYNVGEVFYPLFLDYEIEATERNAILDKVYNILLDTYKLPDSKELKNMFERLKIK